MKSKVVAGALFLVLACGLAASAQDQAGWKELKGRHFLVYYRANKAFAEETLESAEKNYGEIAKDLGYVRYDRFWLWENRVKILIYEDRPSFVRATGAPDWAYAKADYKRKEISGMRNQDAFLRAHLPHEIAHLIFRDFVGFNDDVPLWLNEGFAMREEDGTRSEAGALVAEWVRRGDLIRIRELTAMDVTKVKDTALAKRFYLQSVSLVGYMIDKHGAESFQQFCKALRDGNALEESLRIAYGKAIPGINALESAWLRSVVAPSNAKP